jgi:hypothetical protein
MLPLFGMDNQGGHGVVHKVWSETFDLIPSTIGLTRKIPKTNDKQKNMQTTFCKSVGLPMQTSKCHQVKKIPLINH